MNDIFTNRNDMLANRGEIDMKLTQLGAKVNSVHGVISFIQFNFNQTELFYVYNINAKNQYFLQMVKPYHVSAGVFSRPQEIVQYIQNDIRQFKNASNSNLFDEFVTINQGLYETIQCLKKVFMTYNVPRDKMNKIQGKVDEITALLEDIAEHSSLV